MKRHTHEPNELMTVESLTQHLKECDDIQWLRRQLNIRLHENLRLIDTTITKKRLQATFDTSALHGHPSSGHFALHNLVRELL